MGTIRRVWKWDELLTFSSLSLWELSSDGERENESEKMGARESEIERERERVRKRE